MFKKLEIEKSWLEIFRSRTKIKNTAASFTSTPDFFLGICPASYSRKKVPKKGTLKKYLKKVPIKKVPKNKK